MSVRILPLESTLNDALTYDAKTLSATSSKFAAVQRFLAIIRLSPAHPSSAHGKKTD